MGNGKWSFQISATHLKTNFPKRRCKQLKIVIGLAWCIDKGVGILDKRIVLAFIRLGLKPTNATCLKIHTRSTMQILGKHRSSSFDQPQGPTALAGGSLVMIFIHLSISSHGISICGMCGRSQLRKIAWKSDQCSPENCCCLESRCHMGFQKSANSDEISSGVKAVYETSKTPWLSRHPSMCLKKIFLSSCFKNSRFAAPNLSLAKQGI